jgi:hypothetical protein
MRVFFDNDEKEVIGEKLCAGIDIITNKFIINIRRSGLTIRSRITGEILEGYDITLDLSGEGNKLK